MWIKGFQLKQQQKLKSERFLKDIMKMLIKLTILWWEKQYDLIFLNFTF